jgi:hypothetical protein
MELVSITPPGMVLIIIQGPGHGDLISATRLISDGDLAGGTARAGLASDLDMASAMDMDTVTGVVVGGVPLFIIRHAGADGMGVQDLMASTVIISTCIIISMLTTQIMYTGIAEAYPARVTTEPAAWL